MEQTSTNNSNCWVKGTAVVGSSSSSPARPPTAGFSPSRPSSSPRGGLFFTASTGAASSSSNSQPSTPSYRPQSGIGAKPRPSNVVGATQNSNNNNSTPPRPPPPLCNGTSSGSGHQPQQASAGSFKRGVMDALHDVLKERRVGGAGGGNSTSNNSSVPSSPRATGNSRPNTGTAASELPGLSQPPPRPQMPTPFSASRTSAGGSNNNNKPPRGGGSGGASRMFQSMSSSSFSFCGGSSSGDFSSPLDSPTKQKASTTATTLPPATPNGGGSSSSTNSTPRRPLGSARSARMQPLPQHLRPQQQQQQNEHHHQEEEGEEEHYRDWGGGGGSSSAPSSFVSFFPASELEETLRKNRSMWAQRHSFPSGSNGSRQQQNQEQQRQRLSSSSRLYRNDASRSVTSGRGGGGGENDFGRSSTVGSSLLDLGATAAPPPPAVPFPNSTGTTAGAKLPAFRQMQQQQQDRDGYFPRSFATQQTQQQQRRSSSSSNNLGGMFNPATNAGGGSSSCCSFTSSSVTSMNRPSSSSHGRSGFDTPHTGGSTSSGSASSSPAGDQQQCSTTPSASSSSNNSNNSAAAQQQLAAMVAQLKADGNRLYSERRLVEAHRAYSQGLELDPQSAVLFSNRAAVHLSVNNLDAAIRDCQQAVLIDPAFWRAHVRLARAYALRGACDHAVQAANSALDLFGGVGGGGESASSKPNSEAEVSNIKQQVAATRVWERARLEHEGGNCIGALRLLDDAAFAESVFSDDMAVRLLRTKLQLQVQTQSNMNSQSNSNTSNSSSLSFSAAAATCQSELSKFTPVAVQTLETALGLGFNLMSAASSSSCIGNNIPALPQIPPLMNNFVSGLCELLVASARAAVLSGWHHAANARSTLRLCFTLRPDHGAAVQLERLIGTVSTHMEDAAAAMADGRAAEAHAGLTQALTVDPTNLRLRGSLLLLRCEASIALGRHDAAVMDCGQVLSFDPGNTRALLRRSQANERAGRYSNAVQDMQTAVQLRPGLEEEMEALVERLRAAGAEFVYEESQTNSAAPPPPHPNRSNNSGSFRRGNSARNVRPGTSGGSGFSSSSSRPSSSSFYSQEQQRNRRSSATDNNGGGFSSPPPPAAAPFPRQQTLYDALGVSKDADVSVIRSQYLKKCLVVHPDKLVHLPEQERKQGEEVFKTICSAYEILSDDEQRAEYDVSLLVQGLNAASSAANFNTSM